MITIKRIYEPYDKKDGYRILVDRLWPRGIRKANAHIDEWVKELTPSSELRAWFHEDSEKRYKSFAAKYRKELTPKKAKGRQLIQSHKHLMLVTAVKDIEHSHIPTLVSFLQKL